MIKILIAFWTAVQAGMYHEHQVICDATSGLMRSYSLAVEVAKLKTIDELLYRCTDQSGDHIDNVIVHDTECLSELVGRAMVYTCVIHASATCSKLSVQLGM